MSRLAETAGSWRVAVRVARRSAYRSKARTLLVLSMLALPVFAGSVLALSYTSTFTSADTEASWGLGQADYKVEGIEPDRVIATLPAGSRTAQVVFGVTVVRVGDSYSRQDYQAADVDDPLARGMYAVRTGRAPRGADEVAVTTGLAETTGVRVGGRLAAGMPLRERTVVGVIDVARDLSMRMVVSAGGHPLSDGGPHTLVQLPPGAGWSPEALRSKPTCHIDAVTGSESCSSNFGSLYRGDVKPGVAEQATRTAAFVLVVGFAGTQVALLAGAAFAVGARRQRRELAMVGAVGASPAQISRMVLANGLVLGVVAGVGGVALGALTFWLNRDRVERIAGHPLTEGAVPVVWLAGIALVAVAVGLLAALGPARGAARQTVRAAISGPERASTANDLAWLVSGVLLAAAGAAVAVAAAGSIGGIVTVTAGTVVVLLGVTACSPVLVSVVGRTAARFPLAVRLAARHAARHRLRTAASVAAVCTAVAGSTALMLYNAAENVESMGIQPNARIGQVLIPAPVAERLTPQRLNEITQTLPVRAVVPVRRTTGSANAVLDGLPEYENTGQPPYPSTAIAVGGAELVQAVTGVQAPPAAVQALNAGGAIVFHPSLAPGGTVVVLRDRGGDLRLPAALVPAPDVYTDVPGMVISERTAAEHGLTVSTGEIIVDTTRAPTTAELAAANSITLAVQLEAGATAAADLVEVAIGAKPDPHREYGAMFLVLAVISGLVTLAASAVAVGLATSEMRNDLSTLAAVGAGPRLRRRLAAAQAGLIVGLGALLGVAGGVAPAAGMVAFRDDLAWRVPWLPLAITVLVAPVLAILLTTLLTRPRLTLVRRLG